MRTVFTSLQLDMDYNCMAMWEWTKKILNKNYSAPFKLHRINLQDSWTAENFKTRSQLRKLQWSKNSFCQPN